MPQFDHAGATAETRGIGATGRRMIEPCPAGATREVANRNTKGDALAGFGGVDQAECVAARTVGTAAEANVQFLPLPPSPSFAFGRRHFVINCFNVFIGDRRTCLNVLQFIT